jgi:uncharacterized protein YggU (UPF0235/DUF167 family)
MSTLPTQPIMHIKIRVKVGARAEKVVRVTATGDRFIVSVREKAERGMANDRVLEIFRALYPKKSVKLVKGSRSPSKIVEVR